MPARCIAGRWGSRYASEVSLEDAAPYLRKIASLALDKRLKARIQCDPEAATAGTDDLRAELQAEYSRRMGRWSRGVVAQSEDEVFWTIVHIARKSHEVTHTLMDFCHQVLRSS